MDLSKLKVLVAACLSLYTAHIAQAQTNAPTVLHDGHWLATQRLAQDGRSTEYCYVLMSAPNRKFIGFSSDRANNFSFNVGDLNWDLPPGMDLQITIGNYTHTFLMQYTTPHLLSSRPLTPKEAHRLLTQIENAQTVTLQFGVEPKYALPIQKGTLALDFFRNCATKAGFVDLNASEKNPF